MRFFDFRLLVKLAVGTIFCFPALAVQPVPANLDSLVQAQIASATDNLDAFSKHSVCGKTSPRVTRTSLFPEAVSGSLREAFQSGYPVPNLCVENVHGGETPSGRVVGAFPGSCRQGAPVASNSPSWASLNGIEKACQAQGAIYCDPPGSGGDRWVGTGNAMIIDGNRCVVTVPGHFFRSADGRFLNRSNCSYASGFTIPDRRDGTPQDSDRGYCDVVRGNPQGGSTLFSGSVSDASQPHGNVRVQYSEGGDSGPLGSVDYATMSMDLSFCQRQGAISVTSAELSRFSLSQCTSVVTVGNYLGYEVYAERPAAAFTAFYGRNRSFGGARTFAHYENTFAGTSGFTQYCIRSGGRDPIPFMMGVAMALGSDSVATPAGIVEATLVPGNRANGDFNIGTSLVRIYSPTR